MNALNELKQGLPSKQTTPLNRLIGLSLGIIHIPTAAAGLFGFFLSFIAPPILLITTPLVVLGFYSYIRYWQIYRDQLDGGTVRKTWKHSRDINALASVGLISFSLISLGANGFDGLSLLAIAGFTLTTAFLSNIALKDLSCEA